MVVCGTYLRDTRQPLTHKDSVVVYQIQIVVSYLLYGGQTHRAKHAHTCQTHTTQEGCGVGSCWQLLAVLTSLNPLSHSCAIQQVSGHPMDRPNWVRPMPNQEIMHNHIYIHNKHYSCLARIKLKHLGAEYVLTWPRCSLVDYLTKTNHKVAPINRT